MEKKILKNKKIYSDKKNLKLIRDYSETWTQLANYDKRESSSECVCGRPITAR